MNKQQFDESKVKRDALGRFSEMSIDELKNRQEEKIVKARYTENLTPKIFLKLSTIRKELEINGKKKLSVYTYDYAYTVEVYNDEEYSYKILKRRKLK